MKEPTAADMERALRTGSALGAQQAYQQQMLATPEGRQSSEIREQAHRISAEGHDDLAHALYRDALSLFAADDDSAAAAAARYDLAESYKRVSFGSKRDNLVEAERLLERCLQSEERLSDLLRLAMTHDALGQTKRRLASSRLSPPDRDRPLQASIRHLKLACKLVSDLEFVGHGSEAGYRHNLANALVEDMRISEAIKSHERAISCFKKHLTVPAELRAMLKSVPRMTSLQLGLAGTLLVRGKKKDLERAERLGRLVLQSPKDRDRAKARLVSAEALIALGGERRVEAAREMLRSTELRHLHTDELLRWAGHAVTLGDTHEAVVALRKGRTAALLARKSAIADHEADVIAAQMQRLGLQEARLQCRLGEPIEAFLSLENCSGLRYHDAVTAFDYAPSDAVGATLVSGFSDNARLCQFLQDLAVRVAYAPDDEALEAVLHDAKAQLGGAKSAPIWGEFQESALETALLALDTAQSSASPTAALQRAAEALGEESMRLRRAAVRHDPAVGSGYNRWNFDLSPADLKGLLLEHPDLALCRVHLTDKILVAVAWLDGDRVEAHASELELAGDLLRELVESVGQDVSDDPVASAPNGGVTANLLQQLPLDAMLPEATNGRHLVVLPSLLASLVPWAAAGPVGRTVADRFDALTVLPSTTPLRMRQAPSEPRAGGLLVVPSHAESEAPTHFHETAFSALRGDDRLLSGPAATKAKVAAEAATADVVAFYTHGTYGPGDPGSLLLADGPIGVTNFERALAGAERVELWACRSGVNIPNDWLTPVVDEAFGMDIELHRVGVRSTIGTLWSVPDMVTGAIVERYRNLLDMGQPPPAALLAAQRWWRDHGVSTVRRKLLSLPIDEALKAIGAELGVTTTQPVLLEMLGPVDGSVERLRDTDVDRIVDLVSSPSAWAGFRFVGVFERRPAGVVAKNIRRPLTPEEQVQLESILEEQDEALDVDTHLERLLTEARTLDHARTPGPDQALKVARLYGLKREGCRRHLLLRGLCWLHEALASEGLPDEDLLRLQDEAAIMWLELARGELVEDRLRVVAPTDRTLLARSEAQVTQTATGMVVGTWVRCLRGLSRPDVDVDATVVAHWRELKPMVEGLDTATFEGRRIMALAGELLMLGRDLPRAVIDQWLPCLPSPSRADIESAVISARLACCAAWLTRDPNALSELPKNKLLSHRDMARTAVLMCRAAGPDQPELISATDEALSTAIDLMEADIWGYPSDDGTPFWTSSGAPSRAWRETVGAYLSAQACRKSSDAFVPHFIACLHMGSNLRLGALNGLAKFAGLHDEPGESPVWWLGWSREYRLQLLEDLARLKSPESAQALGAAVDAFSISTSEAKRLGASHPLALTGWFAANCVEHWSADPGAGRTLAFQLERAQLLADTQIEVAWRETESGMQRIREELAGPSVLADKIMGLVRPLRSLDQATAQVRRIAEHEVVIGACVGGQGELLLGAAWRDNEQLCFESFVGEPGSGAKTRLMLASLIALRPDDAGMPTELPSRDKGWTDLAWQLAPAMTELLRKVPNKAERIIHVIAPGGLRALPWAGLIGGEAPIFTSFAAVSTLPHIGFGEGAMLHGNDADGPDPSTLCVRGGAEEPASAVFGHAILSQVRSLSENTRVLEPTVRPAGGEIIEVEALKSRPGRRTRVVRVFGERSFVGVNATTEGITLQHGRALTARNLADTVLAKAECVELWAPVGLLTETPAILDDDRDAMPTLVSTFLSVGACGVLDMAWPVPDLVKALVFEHYSLTRRVTSLGGACALTNAQRDIGNLFALVRANASGFTTATQALEWIDLQRRSRFTYLGIPEERCTPLAKVADAGLTLETLLVQWCQPAHLAAFRWWGV